MIDVSETIGNSLLRGLQMGQAIRQNAISRRMEQLQQAQALNELFDVSRPVENGTVKEEAPGFKMQGQDMPGFPYRRKAGEGDRQVVNTTLPTGEKIQRELMPVAELRKRYADMEMHRRISETREMGALTREQKQLELEQVQVPIPGLGISANPAILPSIVQLQQMRQQATEAEKNRTAADTRTTKEITSREGIAAANRTAAADLRNTPLPAAVEAQKKRIAGAGRQAPVELNPASVDMLAKNFAATGTLPALGVGATGLRQQILNRAGELYPTIDVATNSAAFTANKASLTNLQKSRDAVVAFEATASKNLDLFLKSAKAVVDSGSPIINRPLRAVNEKLLGSEALTAFRAARQTALTEISKVLNNPNLTGQLTDEARKEVMSISPENSTLKQIYAAAAVLKQDMANRRTSLEDQITAITKRIGGAAGSGNAGGTGKKPDYRFNPATGQAEAVQ